MGVYMRLKPSINPAFLGLNLMGNRVFDGPKVGPGKPLNTWSYVTPIINHGNPSCPPQSYPPRNKALLRAY